jgi:hypothetical protein
MWRQLAERCLPAAPRTTLQNESPFPLCGFAPLADVAKGEMGRSLLCVRFSVPSVLQLRPGQVPLLF